MLMCGNQLTEIFNGSQDGINMKKISFFYEKCSCDQLIIKVDTTITCLLLKVGNRCQVMDVILLKSPLRQSYFYSKCIDIDRVPPFSDSMQVQVWFPS